MLEPQILIWELLFLFLFIGVPVYVALGAASIITLFLGDIPISIIPLDIFSVSAMYPLLAVPMFIFAGSLMERGGVSNQIVDFAQIIVGKIKGGLGIVTILGCVFFAAMIGSGPATVAAMGSLMIPSMIRRGYSLDYSVGVTSVGGTLGILIPPSNPMILYGVIANVSISKLFLAGLLPGLLMAICLMIVSYFLAKDLKHIEKIESYTIKDIITRIKNNFLSLLTPFIILGGIYSGIFTPVEASVVAVMYALFLGFFVTKKLNIRNVRDTIRITNQSIGIMVIVVGVSVLFGRVLTLYKVPQELSAFMLNITDSPIIVLVLIVLLLFILGMFMDTLATIVILAPILVPVITDFGIDPIFFGILWVMANNIALLTPPLGPNLFIAMSISNMSLERASKSIMPYLLVLIVFVFCMLFFGERFILMLPNILMK